MHGHLDIPISLVVLSFSCTHPETHTHRRTARWSIPAIVFHIWQTGFGLLLHLPSCPLPDLSTSWWITCGLGWMVPHPPPAPYMPFHPIYNTNLSFLSPICYFAWAAVRFTYAHVCICPHKWFHDPCSQLQLGCHPYMHTGDMLSSAAICLFFCPVLVSLLPYEIN